MARLEDLQPNTVIRGILPDCAVTLVNVQWFGSSAVEITYKDPAGKVGNQLLYRESEPTIEIVEAGRPWSFDGDGELFRLVAEAHRIRLAHLFDPVLAVHCRGDLVIRVEGNKISASIFRNEIKYTKRRVKPLSMRTATVPTCERR